MDAISEDFPADGKPIKPISATLFSSRISVRSSPGSPLSAKPGARRLEEARPAFPSPPLPPCAAIKRVPKPTKSAITVPVASLTTVPFGTCRVKSLRRGTFSKI